MNPAILILLCLALILAIVYYFPLPKASFKSIYAKVPEDTRTALETFRTQKHFKRINAKTKFTGIRSIKYPATCIRRVNCRSASSACRIT